MKINEEYGNIYNESKIQKLAQENARYLVTVFMPTEMIYSTTLRQINYIASWMMDYVSNANLSNNFETKLAESMSSFIEQLDLKNVLIPELMKNEKRRSISLFGQNLSEKEEYFGSTYSTTSLCHTLPTGLCGLQKIKSFTLFSFILFSKSSKSIS